MSHREMLPLPAPRPLPPVPHLFSESVVGGNIRLGEGGQRAEWCPRLALGVCGLNSAVKRGQRLTVRVEGTGHFDLVVRRTFDPTSPSAHQYKPTDAVNVVKFKLKKSCYVITAERKSRDRLYLLATPSCGAHETRHDVTLPRGLDPWLTFNVMWGSLRLDLVGGEAHVPPWRFHPRHGLNIRQDPSLQTVRSVRRNPCAIAVTARPLTPGHALQVSVQPQSVSGGHWEVKVFLTHHSPVALKLHQPKVFYSEKKNIDRFLHEVCVLKKFQGILAMTINAETGTLDVEEDPTYSEMTSEGRPALRGVSLRRRGLHVHKPLYVALELTGTAVTILPPQAQSGPQPARLNSDPAHAARPTAEHGQPEYLDIPADDYLTPTAAFLQPAADYMTPAADYLTPVECADTSRKTALCSHHAVGQAASTSPPASSSRPVLDTTSPRPPLYVPSPRPPVYTTSPRIPLDTTQSSAYPRSTLYTTSPRPPLDTPSPRSPLDTTPIHPAFDTTSPRPPLDITSRGPTLGQTHIFPSPRLHLDTTSPRSHVDTTPPRPADVTSAPRPPLDTSSHRPPVVTTSPRPPLDITSPRPTLGPMLSCPSPRPTVTRTPRRPPLDTTSPRPSVVTTSPRPPLDTTSPRPPIGPTLSCPFLRPPVVTTSSRPPLDTTSPRPPLDTTSPRPPLDTTSPRPPVRTTSLRPPFGTTLCLPSPRPPLDTASPRPPLDTTHKSTHPRPPLDTTHNSTSPRLSLDKTHSSASLRQSLNTTDMSAAPCLPLPTTHSSAAPGLPLNTTHSYAYPQELVTPSPHHSHCGATASASSQDALSSSVETRFSQPGAISKHCLRAPRLLTHNTSTYQTMPNSELATSPSPHLTWTFRDNTDSEEFSGLYADMSGYVGPSLLALAVETQRPESASLSVIFPQSCSSRLDHTYMTPVLTATTGAGAGWPSG